MTKAEGIKKRIELYKDCIELSQALKDREYLNFEEFKDACDADMRTFKGVIKGLERELEGMKG